LFFHGKDKLLAAFLAGDKCVSVIHSYLCFLRPENDLAGSDLLFWYATH
jgi:hypothetical protein